MTKTKKRNEFELILKNLSNLFLKQISKTKNNILNFYKNFIYNIIFFYYYSLLRCHKSKS